MINLISNSKKLISILVTKLIWGIFLIQRILLYPLHYIRNLKKTTQSFEQEHAPVHAVPVPVPQISVPAPELSCDFIFKDRKSDNFDDSLKQNKFHQRFKKTKRNVRI